MSDLSAVLALVVTRWFFFVFWCLTLAAFVARGGRFKKFYLGFFFASLFAAGVGGAGFVAWPFHNWNLWARFPPRDVEYLEVWLEDDRGTQCIYDLRAIEPMSAAFLNKMHAPRLWRQAEDGSRSVLGEWLLERANAYVAVRTPWDHLRFPIKEPGFYLGHGLYENSRVAPVRTGDHGRYMAVILKKKRAVFSDGFNTDARFTLLEERRIP